MLPYVYTKYKSKVMLTSFTNILFIKHRTQSFSLSQKHRHHIDLQRSITVVARVIQAETI